MTIRIGGTPIRQKLTILRTLGLAIALCLPVSACDKGVHEPEFSLQLSTRQITAITLNSSLPLTAWVGPDTAQRPLMLVLKESRWLHDIPVLHPDSLTAGRLYVTGPGTAELQVEAFNATARLVVKVQPNFPTIVAVKGPTTIGPADTIVLRGYRMDGDLGEITFAGGTATVISRDSANIRLRFSTLVMPDTCAFVQQPIRVPRAFSITPLFRNQVAGKLMSLAVGETLAVNAADVACMVLPPQTKYALAFYDKRLLQTAFSGVEYPVSSDAFPLWYDVTGGTQGEPSAARPEQLELVSAHLTLAASSDLTSRTEPLRLGEEFEADFLYKTLKVQRIYGGSYVLATERGMNADSVQLYVDTFDKIMPGILTESVPFFQTAIHNSLPWTMPAARQLLIAAVRSCLNWVAAAADLTKRPDQPLGAVVLGMCPNSNYMIGDVGLVEHLVNREMAHVWALSYLYEQHGSRSAGAYWGWEGMPDFLYQEIIRRRHGMSLFGNHEIAGNSNYYTRSARFFGFIANGRETTAPFLRDLLVRRMRLGEPYDVAVREVARGAIDGWYGHTYTGAGLPGIVSRMRALQPAWDPAQAVLLWVMSHALDDLTNNAELQIPWFRAESSIDGHAYSWEPMILTSDVTAQTMSIQQGGASYMQLWSGTRATVFRVKAQVSAVQWLLARYE